MRGACSLSFERYCVVAVNLHHCFLVQMLNQIVTLIFVSDYVQSASDERR